MNTKDRPLGEKLRRAFGDAPEPCRTGMARTLSGLTEEQPMKKRSVGLLVAAALLVALCGSAIAARHLGVLDFLFDGREPDNQVAQSVQSAFTQEGGDLGPVRATVREAVSDGIAVYMAVAYEALHPEDVVLMEYDADLDEAGVPLSDYPHPGGWADDTRKWVVWCGEALVDGEYALAGVKWRYENPQTLLVQYVIDLDALPHVPADIEVRFPPGIRDFDRPGYEEPVEPITVTLAAGDMAQLQLKSTREVAFSCARAVGLEVTLTPLATYTRLTYRFDLPEGPEAQEAARDAWQEAYGSLHFALLDASGEPVERLTGGGTYTLDGLPYIEAMDRDIFTALPEQPDSLTFAPYTFGEDGERLYLPAFTIPVE